MSLSLILAVLIDQWLGEPKKIHPLILFGNIAYVVEDKIRNQESLPQDQKIIGIIALIILILPFTLLTYFINTYLYTQELLLSYLFSIVILYFCIAVKSLKQHAQPILSALENNKLTLAQQKVSMIVSRQTDKMSATDVRKAAIESILENGADAIFAPIFWFIVAGPAGAVLYRLSNTLDAMWGYKNQQYLYFGWAAARFDDALNWLPARLTALSYAVLGKTSQAIQCWKTQAHLLDSPNAGPVMTSGAGALNLKLGGPAWYHGKLKDKIFLGQGRLPENDDITRASDFISANLYLWISVIVVLELLGGYLA